MPPERSRPTGPAPEWLVLGVNNVCNMHCLMCDVGLGNADTVFYTNLMGASPVNMPLALVERIVEQAAACWPGVKIGFAFTEPLIYPHLFEAIAMARARGLWTAVTTNGLQLDRKADALAAAGADEVFVSLDGPADVHNHIRRHPRGFERAFAGLDALARIAHGPRCAVFCVINEWNVGRLVERVSRDLESWYSLGYPSRPGTGRTASVSVRVKGRDLTVRARRAIVEKSVEEQMSDRVLAHLFQPDERSRIPISASLVGSTPGKGKHVLRLEVRIPIESLALLPTAKGVQGVFSVFVASVAPEGDFSTVTRLNQPFEIPAKDLETAQAGHYTYELEVVTTGPGSRIAIGIWDENSNEAGFTIVPSPRT